MVRSYAGDEDLPSMYQTSLAAIDTGSPLAWGLFALGVLVMIALDLFVFHRKAHEVSMKEAALWSVVWAAMAAAFGAWVWHDQGPDAGLQFYAGWAIEKALAVDNIFVFVAVFGAFAVPKELRHRVLVWGVIGALVLRAIFVGLGAALVSNFSWTLPLFGALLVFTAVKLLRSSGAPEAPEHNPLFRFSRRFLPATNEYRGEKFFVKEHGKWLATPLFLVLLCIETADVIFAVDSIPAIFAVTQDPFLVWTSNVFAILGLRSLYFLLEGAADRFALLKYALALVLLFVGAKLILMAWKIHIPIGLSLSIVVAILAGGVALSLLFTKRPAAS
jgi:tellurite resistance protein TerC